MLLRTPFSVLFVFILSLTPGLTASAQPAVPEVFTATDLEAAIQAAADKSGFVVVNFTSKTSVPSHNMDRGSWKSEDVVAWVNEHAVAVRIYIDEDAEAAKTYRIKDTPTHVIFRHGEEFDRTFGYIGGKDLLAWFKLVEQGERRLDKARALHGDRVDDYGKVDVMAQYKLAKTYHADKEYDKATDEYVWLWQHMLEFRSSMVGVRGSFMARSIKDLVAEHPPARERFTTIRDDTEQSLKTAPDWDDLDDWIVLNEILGDDDKTLAWFDRIKQDPQRLAAAQRVAYRVDQTLRKHKRWADLGIVYADPLTHVQDRVKVLEPVPGLTEKQQRERAPIMLRVFLDNAAQTYAGCLAAGRDAEAQAIADYLPTVVDPDAARIAMIEISLEVGVAQPVHLEWLGTIESPPPGLREKLESALPTTEN